MPPRYPSREVQLRALGYGEKVGDDVSVIVLIGPTGARKSNFIEALGSKTTKWPEVRDIAKARMVSGKQGVNAYRMEHRHLDIYTTNPIILVDTPGLSNPRKSEMQVLLQIKKWMTRSGVKSVDRLFYMDRISENRMTRSRTKSLEIFKALCGTDAASRTVVVTTMWDLMWNPRLKAHAAHRFKLLKEKHWRDFLDQGSRIERFDNTFDAALDNLRALGRALQPIGPAFAFEKDVALKDTEMGRQAFRILTERYNKLVPYLQQVEQDIEQSAGMQNQELDALLLTQKNEIAHDLQELVNELVQYSLEYKEFRNQVYAELDRPGSPESTTTTNTTNPTHRPGGWLAKQKDFLTGGTSRPPSERLTPYHPPATLPNIPEFIGLANVGGGGSIPTPYYRPVTLSNIHEYMEQVANVVGGGGDDMPKYVLCKDPTSRQPHRQQATRMILTPQALDSETWDSIFSGHSTPSPIEMESIANEDIVILLLGTTGSGKSSFIKAFFPQSGPSALIQSRHFQNAQTSEVQAFRIAVPKADYGLVLVDTPGFNATDRLEFSTLNYIAHAIKDRSWLKLRFNGFIYFEPLGDLDFDGRKTILDFIALNICGKENYDRIAVRNPTSFFDNDKVTPLKKPVVRDHWKPILRRDDWEVDLERIWCFDLDLESSYRETRDAIKKYMWALVREPHVRTTSQLQLELAQGLPLEKTSSGIAAKAYDDARLDVRQGGRL